MKIAIGCDHAGFDLKQTLIAHLQTRNHEIEDHGTDSTEPVDYPPICAAVARSVTSGNAERGIVLGGSGQGEAMAANKVHGARAALCNTLELAKLAREHNDANILSIGARIVSGSEAAQILDLFLATEFEGGRHVARVDKIKKIETEECG